MFSNVFRTRGWSALRSCKAPTCIGSLARHVPQYVRATSAHVPRPLSTSTTLRTTQHTSAGQPKPAQEVETKKPVHPGNVLFIANIPFSVEEQEVRERFEVFGPVTGVKIQMTDDGNSRGYGHIWFANPVDALAALRSLNKQPMLVEDRRIRARFPTPPAERERVKAEKYRAHQLFIGNLPFVLEEHELREHFETFGKVSAIRIGRWPDGRARGFAHIDFVNAEDAVATYESAQLEPVHLFGRDLRVDYPQLKTKPPQIFQIFVGNLPPMYEQDDLRKQFEVFGDVAKIWCKHDPKEPSLSYAHVEFRSKEAAQAACDASQNKAIKFLDRHLRVEFAKYREGKTPAPKGAVTALYYEGFTKGEEGIREAFKEFESKIVGVNPLKNNSDSTLNGKGFVNFMTAEDAQKAFDTLHGNVEFHIEFALRKAIGQD